MEDDSERPLVSLSSIEEAKRHFAKLSDLKAFASALDRIPADDHQLVIRAELYDDCDRVHLHEITITAALVECLARDLNEQLNDTENELRSLGFDPSSAGPVG